MKKIPLTLAAAALTLSAALSHAQTPPAPPAAASGTAAARHEARVEERITYLHNQLKITPAQESQWKAFADTIRENNESMARLFRDRLNNKNASALDDIKQYVELTQAGADGAKKLADAFTPLYTSFPPEQKALADTTFRNWLQHPDAGKSRAGVKE
ncbi:Spy/CpxP family protein refolding chaperone [Burkholderia singularis]|uniref:2-polyprenylphenol hydroxylase and related flavodoxin oxidoreductases n=1 Tax=Burkholderia singularis TaxID=1503053 RepID=A0A238HBV0_9BURK|nr:Spy/CpxP family protein refolding chaperone [Burkholderia singularis]SMG02505.1 2-polyprenylphenol hydroxylase and related flavodoxin oxidoreductases [Burkholderia singularis]